MHALMTLTPFVGSGSVRDHHIILARSFDRGRTHLKYTLSLRRSKVTTHTTPRPDMIPEGQRNNGAFRQRSVTVNKGGPRGPGPHGALQNLPFDPGSLSRCSHRWDLSDREACKHATEINIPKPFEKSQNTSQPIRRGLMTKDIWHRQDQTGGIIVGPLWEFVIKTAASDTTRISRQNGVCLDCAK